MAREVEVEVKLYVTVEIDDNEELDVNEEALRVLQEDGTELVPGYLFTEENTRVVAAYTE